MSQVVTNLPWVVLWVVALVMQNRFWQKGNTFGSLILLWITLVIGVFWNRLLGALVPGVGEMWLFGTKVWILFLLLAVRHFFSARKQRKTPQNPPVPENIHDQQTPQESEED